MLCAADKNIQWGLTPLILLLLKPNHGLFCTVQNQIKTPSRTVLVPKRRCKAWAGRGPGL